MLNYCSRFRRFGLTILMFMVSYVVMAQRTISGKVLSGENKQPLTGATITNKKSKTQAITDAEGNFNILASDGDVLVISNIGFSNKEFKAGDATSVIELAVEQTNLSEIVVTALGIKKEVKRLGYSVQEIKGADLVKAREANPINGLVGKIAGLDVAISR
ncbi:MAG: TonB-dependent receptor [Chitinophagaceae bacterium]|nr:TonB-dependent receptor [Chitinophagaceae bacterium]